MKSFLFLVVVLIGCSNAKPYPAKRSTPACSAFPKQISGREYVVTVDGSGSSTHVDMQFNMDMNLQMMQAEATVAGVDDPINMLMDFKGGKTYIISQGYCISVPLKADQKMFSPEELYKELTYETSGNLGLNGGVVHLYSFKMNETRGQFTLESVAGNECFPVSFAVKDKDGATVGSILDVKLTSDDSKMKIPENCHEISRRSFPGLIHSVHLHKAVKRGFPFMGASVTSKKRRFPWIDLQDTRKRGFPWIDLQDTRKRGFPWIDLQDTRKRGFPWPLNG